MSKRAEKAALNAYPPHKGASQEWIKLHLSGGDCACFIKGYEQGEKDTIERTESHLESVLPNFLDVDTVKWIIKDFKKAMEEE